MTDKILVLDFTGTAGKEHESAVRYDFRKLAGTDGYCSEEASIVLKRKLGEFGYEGIHFLDSGNYHYLTKFFLDQIREPFDLAVFDNHTDMQPSALLPLLSCGNWLLETLKENSLVHRVCLIGPPGEAPAEVGEEERKKLCWITREEFRKGEDSGKCLHRVPGLLFHRQGCSWTGGCQDQLGSGRNEAGRAVRSASVPGKQGKSPGGGYLRSGDSDYIRRKIH